MVERGGCGFGKVEAAFIQAMEIGPRSAIDKD